MSLPVHPGIAMARNGTSADLDGSSAVSPTVVQRLFGADADGDPHPLRPTAWTGLALVLLSAVVSVLAKGPLPAQVRIRWTVGTYYGPEFAPAAVVLWVFPTAVAVTYLGFRALARYLEGAGELTESRAIYEVVSLALLVLLVLTQVGLVLANLA